MLPFSDLLEELRARGYGIGLNEYNSVARFLAGWRGVDRIAFRDALAALLARDAEEVLRIREAIDEWYEPAASPPTPFSVPAEAPARTTRRVKPWHVVVAVVMLFVTAFVIVAWRFYRTRVDQQQIRIESPQPPVVATGARQPDQAAPTLPPPPKARRLETPWLASVLLAAAALIALAGVYTKKLQDRWARRYWRSVLADMPGPDQYTLQVDPSEPLWFARDVDELATILGRAEMFDPSRGDALHVEESVRLTLRGGLYPQLVFAPPPPNVVVLVLQDVSWSMRPWQSAVDALLSALESQGTSIERWFFEGNPMWISSTPHAHPKALGDVASKRGDSPLIVISTGQGIDPDSAPMLAAILRKWQSVVWVNPVANRAYWPPALSRLRRTVWPMTFDGLRGAAQHVSYQGRREPESTAFRRRVTRGDVDAMKQLIAMVPYPSLELAQELRRRFRKDIPEEVFLFLGTEGVFYGETIRLPSEELRAALAGVAADSDLERNVRTWLLELLARAKQPEGSVAELRWKLARAIHEIRLAGADRERATAAAKELRLLAGGPLREEVREALTLLRAGPARPLVKDATEAVYQPVPADLSQPAESRPPRLAFPALEAVVVVLAIAGATTLLWWVATDLRGMGRVIPHRVGAYTLTTVGDELRVDTLAKNLPAFPQIFRNGEVLGRREVGRSIVPVSGAWYEARAVLPEGNLATSWPVWVPRVTGESPGVDMRVDFVDDRGNGVLSVPFVLFTNSVVYTGRSGSLNRYPAGKWTLTASVAGFEPFNQQVLLTVENPGQHRVTLYLERSSTVTNPNMGFLSIDLPLGADPDHVYIQANRQPPYPWNGPATPHPAGSYTVTLDNDFYDSPQVVRANVQPGQTTLVKFESPPQYGVAIVRSTQIVAKMSVEVRSLFETFERLADGSYKLRAPAGTYAVVASYGKNATRTAIRITAGKIDAYTVDAGPVTVQVFFPSARIDFFRSDKDILDGVAVRLKEEPDAKAIITGYADARPFIGVNATNTDLARQRAEVVHDYLVTRHGIDPARLTVDRGALTESGVGPEYRTVVIRLIFP